MTPALTQHLPDSTPPRLNGLLQKNAARFTPTIVPKSANNPYPNLQKTIKRFVNPLGTKLDHQDIILITSASQNTLFSYAL